MVDSNSVAMNDALVEWEVQILEYKNSKLETEIADWFSLKFQKLTYDCDCRYIARTCTAKDETISLDV